MPAIIIFLTSTLASQSVVCNAPRGCYNYWKHEEFLCVASPRERRHKEHHGLTSFSVHRDQLIHSMQLRPVMRSYNNPGPSLHAQDSPWKSVSSSSCSYRKQDLSSPGVHAAPGPITHFEISWPLDGTEAQMSPIYLEHFFRHILIAIVTTATIIAPLLSTYYVSGTFPRSLQA